MRQSSASSSMLALQEVADIVFSATRASSDTRLLRSKVGQMIATALQAMTEASCKTLRRRVGQRLRRKLGRILMQEEFEQAVAIYKRYEDDQLNEAEDTAQHENSVTSGEEMSSMSPQGHYQRLHESSRCADPESPRHPSRRSQCRWFQYTSLGIGFLSVHPDVGASAVE
mmetsp:Transcript_6445/g.7306  ORF Transcript_6445/g.7306 Transcript_6445/m.7306 type:complete len:170 (+) Transcript_6445:3-512(+)